MEYTKGENEDADCRPDRESDKDDKGFTKGEWKVSMGGSHVVVMKDGGIFDVAYCDDKDMPIKERNANAERIVKAVNCHDDLVEALKEAINALTIKLDKPKYPEILDFKSRVEPMILQALAKAEAL